MCKAVEDLVEKRAARIHVTYFMKGKTTLDDVMSETRLSETEILSIVEEIKMAQKS